MLARMNKSALLQALQAMLDSELETALREAKTAAEAATDPDSRAENKYDTRALESSYLARGQARRASELREAARDFRRFAEGAMSAGAPVRPGSLVTLESPGSPAVYFVCPGAGGSEVVHEGREITLITPGSPLGALLLGKGPGDGVSLRPGVPARRILAVE